VAHERVPEVGETIVWRLSLASSRDRVFELLDTDEGRERHWAARSRTASDGAFELEFTGGLTTRVELLERDPPRLLAIRYFGSEAVLELSGHEDGGCTLQVTCDCDDPDAWMHFYPGWVSWLLVLKGAAADFGIDLRNRSDERTWMHRYVDP
jgi:uncharacterized protein YndB with AHSA1/START domain